MVTVAGHCRTFPIETSDASGARHLHQHAPSPPSRMQMSARADHPAVLFVGQFSSSLPRLLFGRVWVGVGRLANWSAPSHHPWNAARPVGGRRPHPQYWRCLSVSVPSDDLSSWLSPVRKQAGTGATVPFRESPKQRSKTRFCSSRRRPLDVGKLLDPLRGRLCPAEVLLTDGPASDACISRKHSPCIAPRARSPPRLVPLHELGKEAWSPGRARP
jgi:hypothetical protein